MVTWTDRNGETWNVLFTFGVCDRVKADTGVDLEKAMEDRETLSRVLFAGFGRKLVEVMYSVCADQARDRGIEPEAWADLFDGATVERATAGMMEGIADFFPRSRVGKAIRENLPRMMAEMDDEILKKLKLSNPVGSKGSASSSRGDAA
jgi:hypothetical protein